MKENKFLQNDYGLAYVNPHGIGYKCESFQVRFPPQHQNRQPGMEYVMTPKPIFDNPNYRASGKIKRESSDHYRW